MNLKNIFSMLLSLHIYENLYKTTGRTEVNMSKLSNKDPLGSTFEGIDQM